MLPDLEVLFGVYAAARHIRSSSLFGWPSIPVVSVEVHAIPVRISPPAAVARSALPKAESMIAILIYSGLLI